MTSCRRGVLTLAYGGRRYIEMAKSLARSLMLHSPHLPRAIVADSDDDELKALFQICVPLNREFGSGFRQKLHLDRYTPFHETLFVDGDCLVVRDLDEIWDYFKAVPFGIPGSARLRRGDRDPKVDVDYILDYYHLEEIPKFNSGLIYFDSSPVATAVFETARHLLSRRSELRFAKFDEPMLAVAMALHGLFAVPDQGRTMRTPAGLRGRLEIDVLRGIAVFNKDGVVVEPAVVHFAGRSSRWFEYRRECRRLRSTTRRSGLLDGIALLWIWLLASFSRRSLEIARRLRDWARAPFIAKCPRGVPREPRP